jgi:hypothetical protein
MALPWIFMAECIYWPDGLAPTALAAGAGALNRCSTPWESGVNVVEDARH